MTQHPPAAGGDSLRARSGRRIDELTLDAVTGGELTLDDVRIHPDTLHMQAAIAERAGNPQLAQNFRRAAELTLLPDARVLAVYEALRPHRSSAAELAAIADEFDALGAPVNAALIREAAEVYAARGLLR